ncbi:Sec-independent protein translocase protein TatB [Methylophilus sp. 3sh_L]|uniref:Sec-independent protein translocase protein TatB n=1 Tax=Methylophilus sp. 3sh_L TaxID=3377114 RepID=UPI00398F8066
MFDISFSELLVIALVALVVIGPEKLPKVARTAGAFFGRMQRFVTQVKDEVNREARFAELQQLQDEVKSGLQSVYDEAANTILPTTQEATAEPEIQEVEPVKKPRKPRQRQSATKNNIVNEHAIEDSATAQQSPLVMMQAPTPQAELFAEATAPTPTKRRVRKAVKSPNDAPSS